MKYRNLLAIAASVGALCASANGAAVSLNNFTAPYPIVNAALEPLPMGSGYVGVGTFSTLTNLQIMATVTPADAAALAADFNQFGDSLNFNSGAGDGYFTGQASVASLADPTFVGQDAYLVIGDGATIEDSTLLFVVDSNMPFVADAPIAPNLNVRLDAILRDGELLLGTTVPGIVSAAGTTDGGLGQRIIPEPSAALLSLLGAFGLVLRRRRK